MLLSAKTWTLARAYNVHGGDEECIQVFGWKAYREGLLRMPTHRWEDNIKIDLKETGWGVVDWMTGSG
jgi:hypothetical protein